MCHQCEIKELIDIILNECKHISLDGGSAVLLAYFEDAFAHYSFAKSGVFLKMDKVKKRLYAETIKKRFYHERKHLIKKRTHVALAAVVAVERTTQSLCRFPTSPFEITCLISTYPQSSILARVNTCI
ncbi:hypothetical protein POVCU2_0009360 [Plasmodium ovale curtisi]|uniref:Uncharacterized protein n=1 Tax=Plasmodium ovale curtisi TaxID=864141 RepID=A0A1A8VU78_PLAOA|nr:hypothetical protein POVCU2_0009360 [Plasmodium ovale curtisi]SBS82907.1 hypothetical protein POVCU1_008530 [Plasmodium ovale curtisi]